MEPNNTDNPQDKAEELALPKDSKKLTDELASIVSEYHKSVREEFAAVDADDATDQAKLVRKKLAGKLMSFADTIIECSEHGESDSVRLSAAKFGLTFVLPKEFSDNSAKSPMDKLLDKLLSEDSTDQSEQSPNTTE